MTIFSSKKSLDPIVLTNIFPYLDDIDGLPASSIMVQGFFATIQELSTRESYQHPLLLKTIVHIALDHPRYLAYREFEKQFNVPTAVTDFKISEIVKYYLLNGDFDLDLSCDLNNPSQVIKGFQDAYKSKRINSLGNYSYVSCQDGGSQKFHTLKALFLNDYHFLLNFVQRNPHVATNPSYAISRILSNTSNKKVCLAIVSRNSSALEYVIPKLQNDRKIVLTAVRQDGLALAHASPELKADREVVLAAVRQNAFALEHASLELRDDREAALVAVNQKGLALKHASSALKEDREVVLAAVRQNAFALEHASSALKEDREAVLVAVKQKGFALEHASSTLKADREVVLAAVRQNGFALKHASTALKADREIRSEAAEQNGFIPMDSHSRLNIMAWPYVENSY